MVLLLPLWFVACESEREVGSTLFPEENSGDIVKAFIDNRCFYPKNYMESTVVQTGNGGDLIAGSEQVDLRVQLTNAAPQDLVFSMKVENSVSDAREDDVTWLGEDAISFLNQTVTIKKGELESEEMISFTLDEESGSLKELAESGMVALSLVTTDAVEISENYSTYLWKVNKEIMILLDMIDDMAKRYPGVETDKFFLFGHSGGGQFVNRFLFAHPEKLRACAIGAPGRPTFLNPDEDYFWGTRDFKNYFGHDVDLAAVQKVPVLVIVGENDTKFIGDSPYGDNRVARMKSLQKNLQDHGVHTELTILPGFAHEGGEKERVQAAQHFFEAYL